MFPGSGYTFCIFLDYSSSSFYFTNFLFSNILASIITADTFIVKRRICCKKSWYRYYYFSKWDNPSFYWVNQHFPWICWYKIYLIDWFAVQIPCTRDDKTSFCYSGFTSEWSFSKITNMLSDWVNFFDVFDVFFMISASLDERTVSFKGY